MLTAAFALVVLAAAALGSLFWTTRVAPTVWPTMAEDPVLPRIADAGIRLHGRIAGSDGAPLAVVLHGRPGATIVRLSRWSY